MGIDLSIIGGGIVGLCAAYFYKKEFPGREVALFEAEPFVGDQASSRNSNVLHAGLYYKENSLKQATCIPGHTIWRILCHNWNIPVAETGKFIVAQSDAELADLQALYKRAENNKVPKLRWATAEEEKELSEYLPVAKAIASPHTAIVDVGELIQRLYVEIQNMGVYCLLNQKAMPIMHKSDCFVIATEQEKIKTQKLLNAAGAHAVEVRESLNLTGLKNAWNKGYYLRYRGDFYNKALIYPLPSKDGKNLGLHSCIDSIGAVRFGPSSKAMDVFDQDCESNDLEDLVKAVKRQFPKVETSLLHWDYAGIRAQLLYNDQPLNDFWFGNPEVHGIDNYYEFCGIDSPGFTAAPALARRFVESVGQQPASI